MHLLRYLHYLLRPLNTRRTVCAFLLLGTVALYLARPLWLPLIADVLVVSDALEPADAVLPLAGDPHRPAYAAQLYREGYASLFIVTPLPLPTVEARARYVRQVVATAQAHGVPEAAIVVVPWPARSTYQEGRNVRRFMAQRGLNSLLVVTSPWHTRRSRWVLRDAFRGSAVALSVLPVKDDVAATAEVARSKAWWRDPSARGVTLSEYLKLAAHLLGVR